MKAYLDTIVEKAISRKAFGFFERNRVTGVCPPRL